MIRDLSEPVARNEKNKIILMYTRFETLEAENGGHERGRRHPVGKLSAALLLSQANKVM